MGCNCGKNKTSKSTQKVVKTPQNKTTITKGGTNIRRIIRRSAY